VNPAYGEGCLATFAKCVEKSGMPRPERFPADIPLSIHVRERAIRMEPGRERIRVACVPCVLLLGNEDKNGLFIVLGTHCFRHRISGGIYQIREREHNAAA
jgi:hypothetical protein